MEEKGIRFPEVSLEKDTRQVEDYSTFLQLPKQILNTKKGMNYKRN